MKNALKFVRSINLTVKQAAIVLFASAALFTLLLLAFLNISTGTAAANRDLDKQALRDRELTLEINDLQTEIGKLTSAERMEQRAKDAGFVTPSKVEHLLITPGVAATMTVTPTR
jgi:cell division protein FtsL